MNEPKTEHPEEKLLKTYIFKIKKRYRFGDLPETITIEAKANVDDDEFHAYVDEMPVKIMEDTMKKVERHLFDRPQ